MRAKNKLLKNTYMRLLIFAASAGLLLLSACSVFCFSVRADDTPAPVLTNERTKRLVSADEANKIKFLRSVNVKYEFGESAATQYCVSVLKAEDSEGVSVSYDTVADNAIEYTPEFTASPSGNISFTLSQNEKNTVYFIGLIPLDENSHPSSYRASSYNKVFIVGSNNLYVDWCDFKFETEIDEDNSITLPGYRTYITGYFNSEGSEFSLNEWFFTDLTEYTYSGKAYLPSGFSEQENNPLKDARKIILQSKG